MLWAPINRFVQQNIPMAVDLTMPVMGDKGGRIVITQDQRTVLEQTHGHAVPCQYRDRLLITMNIAVPGYRARAGIVLRQLRGLGPGSKPEADVDQFHRGLQVVAEALLMGLVKGGFRLLQIAPGNIQGVPLPPVTQIQGHLFHQGVNVNPFRSQCLVPAGPELRQYSADLILGALRKRTTQGLG